MEELDDAAAQARRAARKILEEEQQKRLDLIDKLAASQTAEDDLNRQLEEVQQNRRALWSDAERSWGLRALRKMGLRPPGAKLAAPRPKRTPRRSAAAGAPAPRDPVAGPASGSQAGAPFAPPAPDGQPVESGQPDAF